ncbi:hypothetical protein NCCP28_12240 [Niallia sp. NCCP-28]|nr:hypothetical protein NCCP28_12240 [Niallia sp. NCCP-28]
MFDLKALLNLPCDWSERRSRRLLKYMMEGTLKEISLLFEYASICPLWKANGNTQKNDSFID